LGRIAGVVDVGDGRAPAGVGWQGAPGQSDFVPYAVLHRLSVERESDASSVADPGDAPKLTYQINAIGAVQEQAERVADAIVFDLLGSPLVIVDRDVVALRHDVSSGAIMDEDTHPPLWLVAERITVETGDKPGS
jgi:hypothetical protein